MMRVCHLDTCPVGVATQNPLLRKRFAGKPEFVENFFMFIAEEVRELMAELGFRTLDEAVGQVGLLDTIAAKEHWKASKLDLSPILEEVESAFMNQNLYNTGVQDHGLDKALDQQLISASRNALTDALVDALLNACTRAQSDTALRGVVLRGAGGHFCAGGSLGGFAKADRKSVV